jgi:diadenosine tetraphosphate (Ap4A) HIT family hydrolase
VPGAIETCPYCDPVDEPAGGWIYRDDRWLVRHGPANNTAAGGLQIISVRHFIDFADMTNEEADSFGPLLQRLDIAVRASADAERVHMVSTRDRVEHFHAWLYPRSASQPLRGTAFLAAAKSSPPEDVERISDSIRQRLAELGA